VIDPETAEIVTSVAGNVGRIQTLAAHPHDPRQVLVGGEGGVAVLRW
jgi:hypothetical protein